MKRGSVSGLTTMCMAMVVAGLVGVANAAIAAQTIPESGAMVLLGSGLVGLAAWGRKKYRK